MRLILALLLSVTAAHAQEPLDAARFAARAEGRTLVWGDKTGVVGTEQYMPGARVKWLVPDGSCKLGHWWEEATGVICFGYEDGGAPACWRFFETDGALSAQSADDPKGYPLSVLSDTTQPLACSGPMIGA